jgi:hypothetical protein
MSKQTVYMIIIHKICSWRQRQYLWQIHLSLQLVLTAISACVLLSAQYGTIMSRSIITIISYTGYSR